MTHRHVFYIFSPTWVGHIQSTKQKSTNLKKSIILYYITNADYTWI